MADEAEAATKIQAMFRGGQARKEVQEKKAVPEAAPAPKDAPESEPVCPPAAPAKRARKVVKPITFPAAAAEDSAEKKLGDAAVPPSRWEVMPGAPVPEMHIKQNSVDAVHLQSVNEVCCPEGVYLQLRSSVGAVFRRALHLQALHHHGVELPVLL